MIWSIAWKNVWRNRKRSLIVITAVLLGTTAGVFTSGLMKGWVEQRLQSAVYTEQGHLKIYNPEFLNNEEINNTIPQSTAIEEYLQNGKRIKAFSHRVKLMSMAATSRGNTALMLQGIVVEKEKQVSDLYKYILPNAGTYFESGGSYSIIISDKTAEQLRIKNYTIKAETFDRLRNAEIPQSVSEKLKVIENERFNTESLFRKRLMTLLSAREVKSYGAEILKAAKHYRLNSKIVFTFTDKSGELISQAFKVCGVFKTSNTMFDQMNAYVLQSDLAPIAGLSATEYHESGILLNDGVTLENVQSDLRKAFPQVNVLTWKELAPDAAITSDYMGLYYYIIMGFILFALAFGIINTMMMSILERTKELGMLMAIGMNKKRVFSMIMLETIFLTLVGAVAGMLLGWLSVVITGHTGLDFSSVGEGFEAMGWAAIVYPEIDASFFFGVTLMVVATGILSSILPARKALKLDPVEAIRIDN